MNTQSAFDLVTAQRDRAIAERDHALRLIQTHLDWYAGHEVNEERLISESRLAVELLPPAQRRRIR